MDPFDILEHERAKRLKEAEPGDLGVITAILEYLTEFFNTLHGNGGGLSAQHIYDIMMLCADVWKESAEEEGIEVV